MIVIGERINSTRKNIKEALECRNLELLLDEAGRQLSSGADYIDINTAGHIGREKDDLLWLMENIQNKFDCNISIDSPDSSIVKEALKLCRHTPFINSISAEKNRLVMLKELLSQKEGNIIILAMDENGMPSDLQGRINIADMIMSFARLHGIDKKNIFIDLLVKPISTEPQQAGFFLEAVRQLKEKEISCIGGLSNVSFGLPRRDILNAVFLKLALDAGIDAAIIDPIQTTVSDILKGRQLPEDIFILAEDAILGKDDYSMNYIKAYRAGLLDVR
jgi:cobalamin-dependent methionine synthase I